MPESVAIRAALTSLRRALAGIALIAACPAGFAYGPAGHLIAGRVADDLLCDRAGTAIADLGDGQDLAQLGLWADRIRSDRAYADSAPWHYMNIASGEPVSGFEHPAEGDVLWAIDHFAGRLRDLSLGRNERAEALKFLVHFIVDIHQPLHVGLADDRGGNAIRLVFRGDATNLHRLWDTHAIEWEDLSISAYSRSLARDIGVDQTVSLDPRVWAEESLAFRSSVYGFGEDGREPSPAYMESAAAVTRDRIRAAAERLAATLNAAFCDR